MADNMNVTKRQLPKPILKKKPENIERLNKSILPSIPTRIEEVDFTILSPKHLQYLAWEREQDRKHPIRTVFREAVATERVWADKIRHVMGRVKRRIEEEFEPKTWG
jgi:hypothetical protein